MKPKYDWGAAITSLLLLAGCFLPHVAKFVIGVAAFLAGGTIAFSVADYTDTKESNFEKETNISKTD